jgi:hypothetical protein
VTTGKYLVKAEAVLRTTLERWGGVGLKMATEAGLNSEAVDPKVDRRAVG